ncbi:MAG: hypothetical protein ACP5I8_02975, partial [Phycisphaerae bacterium]
RWVFQQAPATLLFQPYLLYCSTLYFSPALGGSRRRSRPKQLGPLGPLEIHKPEDNSKFGPVPCGQ